MALYNAIEYGRCVVKDSQTIVTNDSAQGNNHTRSDMPSHLAQRFSRAQPAPRGALLDGGEVWVKRV